MFFSLRMQALCGFVLPSLCSSAHCWWFRFEASQKPSTIYFESSVLFIKKNGNLEWAFFARIILVYKQNIFDHDVHSLGTFSESRATLKSNNIWDVEGTSATIELMKLASFLMHMGFEGTNERQTRYEKHHSSGWRWVSSGVCADGCVFRKQVPSHSQRSVLSRILKTRYSWANWCGA